MLNESIRLFALTGWSSILKLFGRTGLFSISKASGATRKKSIIHNNRERTFLYYLPEHSTIPDKPLVIVMHGRGGNGRSMELLTRNSFNALADKEGFIVVYPDGVGLNWNDGRKNQEANDTAHRENIDDVGFISALIDLMTGHYGASPEKVFVTGLSNGAIMAYRLACELPERISAIAPVDGNMPRTFPGECRPAGPVSLLAINNTLDPLVPFNGGIIRSGLSRQHLGEVLSVHESVQFWVNRNNCRPQADKDEAGLPSPDGTKVTKELYPDGDEGSEVILVTIHGGGHTWPGGLQYLPEFMIGKTCRYYNAAEDICTFFRKHSFTLKEA